MLFPFTYILNGNSIGIGLSDKLQDGSRIYTVTLGEAPITIIGIYKNNGIWYPVDSQSMDRALIFGALIDNLEKFDFIVQWGAHSVAVKPIIAGQFTSYSIMLPDGIKKILSYYIDHIEITWHFNSDKPTQEAGELGKLVQEYYQSALKLG